jgi:protein-tyrosine phosphatase
MKATQYIINGPWPGQLAIIPRPRGGDWLADEVADWKRAGLDIVVSALTPDEALSMDLTQESDEASRQGMQLVSFPIPDRGTPSSFGEVSKLVGRLEYSLNEGKHVGIHCRQGIGRSAMVTAALLMHSGVEAPDAWHRIESARGCPVPDTAEQKTWVERFARQAIRR